MDHRGLFLTLSICELLKWPETTKRMPEWYKFRLVDLNRKAQIHTQQRDPKPTQLCGLESYWVVEGSKWASIGLTSASGVHIAHFPFLLTLLQPHGSAFSSLNRSGLFLSSGSWPVLFLMFGALFPWILAQVSSSQQTHLSLSSCTSWTLRPHSEGHYTWNWISPSNSHH